MQPVRIYIAAPWESKDAAKEARAKLIEAGFEITSRWIDGHDGTTPEEKQIQAQEDCQDVYDADALVLLNISKSEGKAVETGLALAWQRPVIIVGKRTNIFHNLNIPCVDTIDGAIDQLNEWILDYLKAIDTPNDSKG